MTEDNKKEPKYSVYLIGNMSTGYARGYETAHTFAEVKELVRDFVKDVHAEYREVITKFGTEIEYAVIADIFEYDTRNGVFESYGNYPLRRYVVTKRGAIRQEHI